MPRLHPGESIHQPQRVFLLLIGRAHAARRLLRALGQIVDEGGMVIAEQRKRLVAQPVRGFQRFGEIARASPCPCGEQNRGDVAAARIAAFAKMCAGRAEIAGANGAHAKRQMGEAVFRILPHQPFGEIERRTHIAIGQRGHKRALDQHGIARIGPQRLAEEGGSGPRVTLGAGHQRGQIIARKAGADFNRRGV